MTKVSVPLTNNFCPQTLFLYGTYKKDGTPDFGLFCWFSYCWDGELEIMACIGGEKLTKERIHETKVFSANLVTEEILPFADYCGTTDGHNPAKMDVLCEWEEGRTLHVPTLSLSPVTFELEVARFLPLDDGEVMLCKIRDIQIEESLLEGTAGLEDKLRRIAPVRTTCETYFGWDGKAMGAWGDPGKLYLK